MSDGGQLALRPDQAGWEAELWARHAIRLVVYGTPPTVPIVMPDGAADMIRDVVADVLAEAIHPEQP